MQDTTDRTDITTITVDDVEALAERLTRERSDATTKLLRLIRAYARILGIRESETFKTRPCCHGDEAGHYDSSYPPRQVYADYTGPALIQLHERETEDVHTSGGYYYSWRRVTTDRGLYIDAHGHLYGGDETGTGKVGQFAAYSGDCDVQCDIQWTRLDLDSHEPHVPYERLMEAELELRRLAFPRATEKEGQS